MRVFILLLALFSQISFASELNLYNSSVLLREPNSSFMDHFNNLGHNATGKTSEKAANRHKRLSRNLFWAGTISIIVSIASIKPAYQAISNYKKGTDTEVDAWIYGSLATLGTPLGLAFYGFSLYNLRNYLIESGKMSLVFETKNKSNRIVISPNYDPVLNKYSLALTSAF